MPFIAVVTVAVLCGNIIAHNASAILTSGLQVILSVCCLHASGFFFGYFLSRMLAVDVSSSRTISIEVGMQVSAVLCLQTNVTIPCFPNIDANILKLHAQCSSCSFVTCKYVNLQTGEWSYSSSITCNFVCAKSRALLLWPSLITWVFKCFVLAELLFTELPKLPLFHIVKNFR